MDLVLEVDELQAVAGALLLQWVDFHLAEMLDFWEASHYL